MAFCLLLALPATRRGCCLAMVELVDRALGQLLGALEEAGVADNTLVLLAGNNGVDLRFLPRAPPLTGSKGSLRGGVVRTPLVVRWPGRVSAVTGDDRVVAGTGYLSTLIAPAGGTARGFAFLETSGARTEPLFSEVGATRPCARPLLLVVDTRFEHALAFPGESRGTLRLYAGRDLLGEAAVDRPSLSSDVYHRPAYLGVDLEGDPRSRGRRGEQLMFNDDRASLAGGGARHALAAAFGSRACDKLE